MRIEWSEATKRRQQQIANEQKKRWQAEEKKRKSSKRKKITASALTLVAVAGVFMFNSLFAHAAESYVTGTFIMSPNGSGSLTGAAHTTETLQQSYNLTANGTPLWEFNLYTAFTNGYMPPNNQGYIYVEKSKLPTSTIGYQTSFSGGYGNPYFAEAELTSGDYKWTLNDSGVTSTNGGQQPPNGTLDWLNASDVANVNGMKMPSFNATTQYGSSGAGLYLTQSNLSLSNVPNPQFTFTLSSTPNGSSVSSIAVGQDYFINPTISSYGANGGGYFSNNYMSAYWVPVLSGTGTYGTPVRALYTSNGTGGVGLAGWPDPTTVAVNGGASDESIGYPSGFPGNYETVSDTAVPSTGQLEVAAPPTIQSGATGYDLVVYYGDGVQKYDAQVASFSVPAQTPPPATCTTPLTFTQGGTITATSSTESVQIKGTPGDVVSVDVNGSTVQDTLSPSGYGNFTVTQPSGATSTMVKITGDTDSCATGETATIDWPATAPTPPPSTSGLTLTANPTSQTVGSASTLTASYSGSTSIGSNSIVIHDLGGRLTLNNGSTTTYTGFSGQTTATTTALANSAYTESYDATAVNANGQTVTSNQVSVTWSAAAPTGGTGPSQSTTFSLTANPTSLAVGSATTLTVTVPPDPSLGVYKSGEFIVIYDTTKGQMIWPGGDTGQYPFTNTTTTNGIADVATTTYTSNTGGAQNFEAELWYTITEAQSGAQPDLTATASADWVAPTITATATPVDNFSGMASQLNYQTVGFATGDYTTVSGTGGQHMWNEANDTNPTDSYSETETPANGGTATVNYTLELHNSSGMVLSTALLTVTWQAPTVTMSANPTSNMPGQTSTLAYSVNEPLPSGYSVSIVPSGNGANRWSATGLTAQTGTDQETENPAAGGTTTVNYTVEVINDSTGQTLATGATSVSWTNPWTGMITLSASPQFVPTGQPTTLTATTTQAVPSGWSLTIMDETTGQMVGASAAAPEAAQYTSYNAETDTFVAYLNDGYENVGNPSNAVRVVWSQLALSANPTQLPSGQSTTLTVSGQNVPAGDYLVIYNQSTGQTVGYSLSTPYSVSTSEASPQTDNFVAYISSNSTTSGAIMTSNVVPVDWYGVMLSATPTMLPTGSISTLTATAQNMPAGYELDIVDQTSGQTIASGQSGQSTLTTTQTMAQAETDTYVAQVMKQGSVSNELIYYDQTQPRTTASEVSAQVATLDYSPLGINYTLTDLTTSLTMSSNSETSNFTLSLENNATGQVVTTALNEEEPNVTFQGGAYFLLADMDSWWSSGGTPLGFGLDLFLFQATATSSTIAATSTPVSVSWYNPIIPPDNFNLAAYPTHVVMPSQTQFTLTFDQTDANFVNQEFGGTADVVVLVNQTWQTAASGKWNTANGMSVTLPYTPVGATTEQYVAFLEDPTRPLGEGYGHQPVAVSNQVTVADVGYGYVGNSYSTTTCDGSGDGTEIYKTYVNGTLTKTRTVPLTMTNLEIDGLYNPTAQFSNEFGSPYTLPIRNSTIWGPIPLRVQAPFAFAIQFPNAQPTSVTATLTTSQGTVGGYNPTDPTSASWTVPMKPATNLAYGFWQGVTIMPKLPDGAYISISITATDGCGSATNTAQETPFAWEFLITNGRPQWYFDQPVATPAS